MKPLNQNKMKQTAVEWLFEKLWNTDKDKFTWYAILKQAKEMEKDQIIDAFGDGAMDTLKLGKEYYNYLYNKQ